MRWIRWLAIAAASVVGLFAVLVLIALNLDLVDVIASVGDVAAEVSGLIGSQELDLQVAGKGENLSGFLRNWTRAAFPAEPFTVNGGVRYESATDNLYLSDAAQPRVGGTEATLHRRGDRRGVPGIGHVQHDQSFERILLDGTGNARVQRVTMGRGRRSFHRRHRSLCRAIRRRRPGPASAERSLKEYTMQRMPKIERENIDGDLAAFHDAVTGLLGRVPNFYRTISHAPWYAMLLLPFNAAVQRQWPGSRLSGRVKEMVVIKTSHVNGCRYCYAHNTALGRAAGISDDEVAEISSDAFVQSQTMSDAEKLAVRWAEAVTVNKAAGDDALYAEMSEVFSDAEIVELTMVCAMFNMINRLNDSLRVPVEDTDEIGLIKRSLHMDPAKVQAYVRWVAENWPADDPQAFGRLNEAAEQAATWPSDAGGQSTRASS